MVTCFFWWLTITGPCMVYMFSPTNLPSTKIHHSSIYTLPKTIISNIALENGPSQRKLVFQPSIFQVRFVSSREGRLKIKQIPPTRPIPSWEVTDHPVMGGASRGRCLSCAKRLQRLAAAYRWGFLTMVFPIVGLTWKKKGRVKLIAIEIFQMDFVNL